MIYPFLASLFFFSLFLIGAFCLYRALRPGSYQKRKKKIFIFLFFWFTPYLGFVLFFCGPETSVHYPPPQSSPYYLPWQEGVKRWVIQGNRSFTSHRELHRFAWDFYMPIGTPVLAAREGKIIKIIQNFDGIGFHSNFVHILHQDGQVSGYAHVKKNSVPVKVGDFVRRGQTIALSGLVGETIIPHLHFYVLNAEQNKSIPVSFHDVPGTGVPLAGHFYTSKNQKNY